LLAGIVFLPALAAAQPLGSAEVQVGRYATVSAAPLPEQIDLLRAVVSVHFPRREVQTVGEALHHLLQPSGFRLADAYASDPAMQTLLRQPLPEVQRQLGPCSLQAALTTLAGPVYRLVVDPPHRLVSFELTDPYRALVRASASSHLREKRNAALRR
jgi:type IV pili sensor histidine kinase/response regulator